MKNFSNTQKLSIAGISIALYLVTMLCTQSFAFGQYQIRIATAIYGLSAIFPFLILPLALANLLSNLLLGSLGILDIVGGFMVGLLTTGTIVLAKRRGCGNWCVLGAITFIPGLGVPLWLSLILDIPYLVLVASVIIGQAISGCAAWALVAALEKCGFAASAETTDRGGDD